MSDATRTRPPVVILGGTYNALSIARSLGRRGIDVFLSVAGHRQAVATRYKKAVFPIPSGADAGSFWAELLLGSAGRALHGSVLFPCNDHAVTFTAKHHDALAERYILDDSVPEMQLAMLNKQRTLELARSVGVPTPSFWSIDGASEIDRIAAEVTYPVIVKPHHSHLFQGRFGGVKFFTAGNQAELRDRLKVVLESGLGMMVTEFIPGPDTLGTSYYTYMDGAGTPMFHLTKGAIRRYPINAGAGCYHITTREPDTIAVGRAFLEGIGFRGFAHVEFKRDPRDGQIKVMECNPRFTVPHELLTRAGIDTSLLVYNHLVGIPLPRVDSYKVGLRLWFPIEDYAAYRQLRESGGLTFWGWLKSLSHPLIIPELSFTDPRPAFRLFAQITRRIRRSSHAVEP